MHFINQNIFPSTMKKSIKVLVFHINICSAHSSFYFEFFFLLQLAPDWNNYKPLSTPGLAVQEGFWQMNRDFHRVADRGIFLIPEINGVPINPHLHTILIFSQTSYSITHLTNKPSKIHIISDRIQIHRRCHLNLSLDTRIHTVMENSSHSFSLTLAFLFIFLLI